MKKELITQTDPKSPISEVFRALRTNLQFMNKSNGCQTILVTSTVQSEGKSWISANLAAAFAQSGSRILLIDADMRKPRQHKIFQQKNTPGLSNYLSGINEYGKRQDLDIYDCIQSTEVDDLYLLPSGNIPPNPSELLLSNKTEKLIKEASKNFDVILFDGAPCLLVTDSTIISSMVQSTILVTSYKYTKIDDLKDAKKRIRKVGGNIVGVVLNRIEISSKKYENKYYYSSNSSTPATIPQRKSKKIDLEDEEHITKKQDREIDDYIEEKVADTEKQIQDAIKENKKYKEKVDVPSDKAKDILKSINGYK